MEKDEDIRMLRLGQVLTLIPVSKVHIYRMIKGGEFPAPIKLNGVSLWCNEEIRQWKMRRMASRHMLVETILRSASKRDLSELV
jgi:predicted DNA-binding transcriptional regulator AlpA